MPLPANWRGYYSNQNAAAQHRNGGRPGRSIWSGRDTIATVATFLPAGSDTLVCGWEPSQNVISLQERALPNPSTANAGQFARVNGAGTEYETADVAVAEEIEFVTPDELTGTANALVFNKSAPTDGTIYVFEPEASNTGQVMVAIGGSDYAVLKAAEGGGVEVLEGGEIVNDEPTAFLFHGSTMYWFGTTLGSAARADVGVLTGELAALAADGDFPLTVLPLTSMFTRGALTPANTIAESDDIGATRRSIASALASFGVTGVTIGGSGNELTITTTRPGGTTGDLHL